MSIDFQYYVQCPWGHVLGVKPGTKLEKRCKERAQKYLDALGLGSQECPECVEQQRRDAEENARMTQEAGCPGSHGLDEQCDHPQGCLGMTGIYDIVKSPYVDQVIWLPPQPAATR